ncbi:hypothetical protein C5167_050235 [Papaver somniferum]|uniref:Uncharacterized protein n=1 Tax=Papaver somniferum TaxID=3469 RepID=A0A4Y7KPJ4_PAPSO|nr:hypothetical protein C5167_050235 [Papaver somniferum]
MQFYGAFLIILKDKLNHCQILKYQLRTNSAIKKIEDNNSEFHVDIRAYKKMIKFSVKKMCEE